MTTARRRGQPEAPEPGTEKRYIPVKVLFVLGVVWVVALPLLVAVLVTALLPEIGRLRADGGGWRVLHLLWIYPTFVLLTFLVVGPVARRVGLARPRVVETLTETVLAWLLLAALLQVFFEQRAGAAVAGALALAALRPFAALLERTAPRDDDGDAPAT